MSGQHTRDLLTDPLWREEDLGAPVPDSPHATSVAMPLWQHVIGYEEKRPEVIERLRAGYPRFAIHPSVRALWNAAEAELAGAEEGLIVLPSERAARRCGEFLQEKSGVAARLLPYGDNGLWAAVFPESERLTAQRFWQHFGDVLSSRRADAARIGAGAESPAAAQLRATLRARIAGFAGAEERHVFLYSSGMAAMAAALRALRGHKPGLKTVQLGFPYVDGLKMQTVSGPGAHFFPVVDEAAYDNIAALAKAGEISGVFCESPGNPLLETPDLPRLSTILRPHGVPLVVDDTVASFYNVDVLPYADLLASSLTKLVSGVGDVMAGSLVVSSRSPLAHALHTLVSADHDELLWEGDAEALERNSRDYEARAASVNKNVAVVAEHLRNHPQVAQVWHPSCPGNANYELIRKPAGGYGGLLSFVLHDAEHISEAFYDHLRITKGPSLGTNFSLVCPYTLLAHYDELEWAESLGISRYLIRCSIGLEPASDITGRFDEAIAAALASR